MRQGYDITTMCDVADEVGGSRGIVYLHFDSKEKLFEALIQREVAQYAQIWLEHIEADPRGGTIDGIYRAVLYAISSGGNDEAGSARGGQLSPQTGQQV